MLAPGAAFAAGLLAADRVKPGPAGAGLAGLLGLALLAAARLHHGRQPDPTEGELLPRLSVRVAGMLLLGSVLLGFFSLGVREHAREASPLARLDGRVLELRGRVVGDPRPAGEGWAFALASRKPPGRIWVRGHGAAPEMAPGDRVRLDLKLAALDRSDPFEDRLARRGFAATGTALSSVRVGQATANPLLRAANHFRRRFRQAAEGALDRNRAALLLGLVIGDDGNLSPRAAQDFRAAGLTHLTAVSGSNVAVVLGAVGLALAALRAPRRAIAGAGLATIVLFALVTRWEPSVLRASVMAALAILAFLFGRVPHPGHALGVALLGLLAAQPRLLWSVGFQLSFAATAGILWLRPVLVARWAVLPRPLAEAAAVGIAAQAAVLPLVALHFERISVAAIPANLAAAALVAPATVAGLAGGVVALAAPSAAGPLLELAGWPVAALLGLARLFGRSDAAEIATPGFGLPEVLGAYLLLAAAWCALARRPRSARWPAATGVAVLVAASLAPALEARPPEGLRITFFDVGEGDAALVESAGGARILVDGGPEPARLVADLKRRGVGRLDLVVVSHLHADHAGGLPAVLRELEVGLAVHPGVPAPAQAVLAAEGPLQATAAGESWRVGDLRLDVVGPTPELRDAATVVVDGTRVVEGTGLNDASVVLRLGWAGECVLFTGDVEEAGQEALLEAGGIDCTVLKAPHHGSARLVEEFVARVDPEWVVVSVGPNRYGHPTARALQVFEAVGARILRTDRLDDVVLEIDARGTVRLAG